MSIKKLIAVSTLVFFSCSIANAQDVFHYQLKNGLNLFVKVDKRAPVVSSQVWYKVGSTYENEENGETGISHMLEHMMFGGSKNYPSNSFSQIIAANGGQENATTSYDYTYYFQTLAAAKLPISLQLESDRMNNLIITNQYFVKENKVVQEERRLRIDNNPQSTTYEKFMAEAFKGTPYHHPVAGWMPDLQKMTAKDVERWYKTWYSPNNAIVIIVGDVDPAKVYDLTNKYFGSIPAAKLPEIKSVPAVATDGPHEITVKVPAKLPWLIMGYQTPSLLTAKEKWQAYALEVASAILDSGKSSRFSTDLIRGSQIATNADADYDLYSRLSGSFAVSGTPSAAHTIDELKSAFLVQIKKLQTQPVSADELERIKNQVIAQKIYAKDSIFYQGTQIGELESVGIPWQTGENYVSEVEKITPQQIQEVAKEYLIPQRLTVATLVPLPIKGNINETPAVLGGQNVH